MLSFVCRRRKIKQNVRIKKTVGIDLRSNETGFQKNCTEIVQQCYTETVRNIFVNDGGRNARSKGIIPATGMMTRKRAAAMAISKNKENLKVSAVFYYHEKTCGRKPWHCRIEYLMFTV